jgi:hypothetical protein
MTFRHALLFSEVNCDQNLRWQQKRSGFLCAIKKIMQFQVYTPLVLLLLLRVHCVFSTFCNENSVPYRLKISTDGTLQLGCATPICYDRNSAVSTSTERKEIQHKAVSYSILLTFLYWITTSKRLFFWYLCLFFECISFFLQNLCLNLGNLTKKTNLWLNFLAVRVYRSAG